MAKKIIDIFPPKSVVRMLEKAEPKTKKAPNIWKKAGLLLLALIVLVFVSLHFFFSKVEIELRPVTEISSFKETLTVDSQLNQTDFDQKAIPGKIFETEKLVSDEFLAQGRVLKKAEGTIRLYNAFTTRPETWLKGTRFVSSEGKLFLSKERIQVPGALLQTGKIVPSFVDVPVAAAEGGKDYNIGPSNFSVAAFLGTARYTSFYGESTEPMSGGGEFPMLEEDDLQMAERVLTERAGAEAEAELRKIIPEDFVFSTQAIDTEILEKAASVEAGAESEKFAFRVATKSRTLAFSLKDIDGFADFIIRSKIAADQTIWTPSLKTEYRPESVNLSEGRMVVSLKGSAKVFGKIDSESLKRGLSDKSLQEARVLLAGKGEVKDYEIKVFPFWLSRIPDRVDKVEVRLVVD